MHIVLVIILFVIFDFIYVSLVAPKYSLMINNIQKEPFKINIVSAMLSYIVLIVTLLFVVFPYAKHRLQSDKSIVRTAFFAGFLIGFAIYGVFNTTNVAIFRKYSIKLAMFDIIWGSMLFFIATLLYLSPSVFFILKPSK